jgi:Na+(H+)/acetate symporter ActP
MALYSIAFSMAHIFGHKAGMQMVDGLGFDSTWYIITIIGGFCFLLLLVLRGYLKLKKSF